MTIAFRTSNESPPPHRTIPLWTVRKDIRTARAIIRVYQNATRPVGRHLARAVAAGRQLSRARFRLSRNQMSG